MTAAASPQAGPSDIDPFKIARWDLVPGRTPIDVLRATLPAGTVSGAPKVRAM